MLRKEDIFLIIYFILVIFFLAAFTIVFFVVYQKRKNKLLQERLEAEQRFRDELNTARLEIQEATLKNVSWELHDNIGQLMAVASMQLKLLQKKTTRKYWDRGSSQPGFRFAHRSSCALQIAQ